uniref:Uncharacterized protein n=1 Tax=Plectus sambesii TaxID=2011161 RepID=A0A914VYP6_9BILA
MTELSEQSTAFCDGFDKGVRVAANLSNKVGCIEGSVAVRLQELAEITSPTAAITRQIEQLKKIQRLCLAINLEPHEGELMEKIAVVEKLAKQAKVALPPLTANEERTVAGNQSTPDSSKLVF